MKINLINYEGNKVPVEIPDNTEFISGVILSGDMVMKQPFYKDSSNDRIMDFYDGDFYIEKKDFHLLDEVSDSYEL